MQIWQERWWWRDVSSLSVDLRLCGNSWLCLSPRQKIQPLLLDRDARKMRMENCGRLPLTPLLFFLFPFSHELWRQGEKKTAARGQRHFVYLHALFVKKKLGPHCNCLFSRTKKLSDDFWSVPSDATEQENELTPLCPGGDCLYFLSHTHTYTNRLVSRSQISGDDHAVSTITLQF